MCSAVNRLLPVIVMESPAVAFDNYGQNTPSSSAMDSEDCQTPRCHYSSLEDPLLSRGRVSRRLALGTPHDTTSQHAPVQHSVGGSSGRSIISGSRRGATNEAVDRMLSEILSEVKETKSTMDQRMKSVEERLVHLEQTRTSGSEGGETPKQRVPTHVRVNNLLKFLL